MFFFINHEGHEEHAEKILFKVLHGFIFFFEINGQAL